MPPKRSYDDSVQDEAPSLSTYEAVDPMQDASRSSSSHPTLTSHTTQGKQRRLSFVDENGDCASAPTSSRPHALPSSSRARFVPGLQTFVGGLQMSRDSPLPHLADTSARTSAAIAPRRSIDTADAMQPLMMSRNADAERRASQAATARRRSEEALEAIVRRTGLVAQQPQLVPGVSPGWHVEAHGRQAMELQDGIRFQDEDGWTPLEAFPAATRQGKLAVKRAKMRRPPQPSHRRQSQPQSSRQQRRQSSQTHTYLDTMALSASDSESIPAISVEPALSEHPVSSEPPAPSLNPATADVEMTQVDLDPLSPRSRQDSPMADVSHISISSLLSPSQSTAPSSSTLSTPSSSSYAVFDAPQFLSQPAEPAKSAQRSYSLSDFDVVDTLGTGTFGRVLLVRLKGSDVDDRSSYFALKVLAKVNIVKLKQVSHIQSERSILTKVDHPFVVNMVASFQDSKNCYMLMEYVVGGEIFSYLRRAGQFSADVARFYISTIVLALEYLHNQKVVYRDLKPENLLLDSNGYTKIADFGFAKEVQDRTWTLCGTPEYLAPEIIQCSGHGSAVDWWSLGILLYEMLAGYPPFYDPNPIVIYEKILAGRLVFPEGIDSLSRDLISSLLTADRSRRLGNLRGGASDVKRHPWFHGVDWKALQEGRIPPPIVPYLGRPGDTSNFSKYEPARPSAMPGLFGTDHGYHDPHADLFPDF